VRSSAASSGRRIERCADLHALLGGSAQHTVLLPIEWPMLFATTELHCASVHRSRTGAHRLRAQRCRAERDRVRRLHCVRGDADRRMRGRRLQEKSLCSLSLDAVRCGVACCEHMRRINEAGAKTTVQVIRLFDLVSVGCILQLVVIIPDLFVAEKTPDRSVVDKEGIERDRT